MHNDRLVQTHAYLKQKILQLLPQQARLSTDIPGLMISRYDHDRPPESCFYHPMIAMVVQGHKRSMIGNQTFIYGQGQCMVVGVDLPGVFHISRATPKDPFISISIKLDKHIISQLLSEMAIKPDLATNKPTSAVVVSTATHQIIDTFLRLIELLEQPQSIGFIAPLLIKELHYYLLNSPLGQSLRFSNLKGANLKQIAKAINWLRNNYTQPLDVDTLLKLVNMSSSTFHRHFRQVTTLSPLQFQKQLRLYEAERLMLQEGKDVKSVAFQVGYESQSQFSREYKRQFGASPNNDMLKKRY